MRALETATCWASAILFAWASSELAQGETLAALVGSAVLCATAVRNLRAPFADERLAGHRLHRSHHAP